MNEAAYDRKLASIIDHTLLKPEATKEDFDRLVEEAKKYHFRSVCVHSSNVEYVARLLEGSDVIPIAVVGFPHGQMTPVAKAFEAHDAIVSRGAQEIDMVINISSLKSKYYVMVLEDIKQVVGACEGKPVKVILETGLLTRNEKICGCCLAKAAGAKFIKTSTGMVEGGATVEDVRLIREIVGDELLIKASGGVKTREFAYELIRAGANRIGTSRSVELVSGDGVARAEGY
ncbi:MAG TPA: deoxyribose-phosphate aldolase [bacterium]|nr:deoxyribose-phosphate aldolase [bacterium]HPQ67339.1 deoxyribose-phosphate aldolase [bacterium]